MDAEKPEVTITTIDFARTPLAGPYSAFYAKIIDGLFTPSDCTRLLALAFENGDWHPAGLSTRDGAQTVHTDFRNSDRLLVFDEPHAAWIYAKLRPYIEEIHKIEPEGRWGCVTGRPGKKQSPTWVLAGVNPRLSFLRYGPGHYFKPHCDGLNDVGAAKSFVTIHLYLNDSALANSAPLDSGLSTFPHPPQSSSAPGVDCASFTAFPTAAALAPSEPLHAQPSEALRRMEPQLEAPAAGDDVPLHGGATRFWTPDKKAHLDVHPKLGRVLVFQQRMLVHSGEEVAQGVKYTMRSDFLFTQ